LEVVMSFRALSLGFLIAASCGGGGNKVTPPADLSMPPPDLSANTPPDLLGNATADLKAAPPDQSAPRDLLGADLSVFPDLSPPPDLLIPPDLAANICPTTYASCTTLTDMTASTAVTIGFGGTGSSGAFTYSPNCIKIHSGTTVTFSGDFSSHPLATETCSPTAFTPPGSGITTKTFTPSVGVYNYFCQIHTSIGMKGVIQVVP
jgi:plastocyanin